MRAYNHAQDFVALLFNRPDNMLLSPSGLTRGSSGVAHAKYVSHLTTPESPVWPLSGTKRKKKSPVPLSHKRMQTVTCVGGCG